MESDNKFDVLKLLFKFMPYVFWKDRNGVYYGANLNQAKALGLSSPSDILGKTIEDLINDQEEAEMISKAEQKIMNEGISITFEEKIDTLDGKKNYISQRHPFTNEKGEVEGLLGFSIDVTELQNSDTEEFLLDANQLIHDVNNPIATIMLIAETCNSISKEDNLQLKEAAINIKDRINRFVNKFKYSMEATLNNPILEPLPVSAILMEILKDKDQFDQLSLMDIEYIPENASDFCFINADYIDFKYIIYNILINVTNIFKSSSNIINLKLETDNKWVKVVIKNEGEELTPKIVDEIIKSNEGIKSQNYENSLELTQIKELIQRNNGTISIESRVDSGTTITLIFRKIKPPKWIAEEINLEQGDIVLILDDDISSHGAWSARFEPINQNDNSIQIKHMELAQDAIDFLDSLTLTQRRKVFFLTKYELADPELNGIKIIRHFKLEARSIAISPSYNKDLIKSCTNFGIKILPEVLAYKIPIHLHSSNTTEPGLLQDVEVIIVDDNLIYSKMLIRFAFPHQLVEEYDNPEVFLENVEKYPKSIKICLDNHFANSNLTGVELAQKLYEKGYTRLYLLSGKDFNKKDMPKYLIAIAKDDLHSIKNKLKKK